MRKLLCLAATCAALACRKEQPAPPPPPPPPAQPAPPQQVAEQEPNDFQHAQAIPARAVVAGRIDTSGPKDVDTDWYRVEAGPGKTLALRIESTEPELKIYDRDRNRVLELSGRAPAVVPAVACAEACFIEVLGRGAGRPYTLTVLGGPPAPGQELEPNDRAVDATPLEAGKPMQGTYLSADDEDWYRLALPSAAPGQFLRVEVTSVEGVRPELEVRALADGALLATLRAGGAGEALLVRDLSLGLADGVPGVHLVHLEPDGGVANPDAGDADAGAADASVAGDAGAPDASVSATPRGYFLVLKSGYYTKGKLFRGAAPLAPYALTATLESGPPDLEIEPNDDPQHATPLSSTATGWLAPAGDQDWYRVHADAPSVLHVELSGVERADLELAAFGPPPKPGDVAPQLARANEGGAKEGEVLPAVGIPAGDSFVLVQSAQRELDGRRVRDGEDRDHPYKLGLTLSPDDGSTEREPNGDVASAQTVALPASVRGWIWPRKDVDVFRFHVAAGRPPVSITLPAVRGMDLQLRLLEVHGDKGEVIGASDSVHGEGDEKLLSVPLKEGDYAVEVSSPRGRDASATQAYTLSIQ